jgi:parvulin-like peptidyl-prolyl isomerase
MAKSKAQPAPRARPSARARHADSERWNRILIIGAVVAVIIAAIGFIAYGWYDTKVKPLNKTVLTVGETKVSLAHLERRMEYELKLAPGIENDPNRALGFADEVLAQMEFEGTVLASIGELNITVSDEEIATEVKDRGNLAEDVDPQIYAAEFRRQVKDSGLKENEYRQVIAGTVATDKLAGYFAYIAPNVEPQVKARWMTFDASDAAQQALDRVRAGEDFVAVGSELAVDPPVERDWGPRGSLVLPTEVEDFLFAAQAGQISDVISVSSAYYVAELQDIDPARSLTDEQRQQVAQRNMNDWIREQNGKLTIEKDLSQEDALKAISDVFG